MALNADQTALANAIIQVVNNIGTLQTEAAQLASDLSATQAGAAASATALGAAGCTVLQADMTALASALSSAASAYASVASAIAAISCVQINNDLETSDQFALVT